MGQKIHPLAHRAGKIVQSLPHKLSSTSFGYKKYHFAAKTTKEYTAKFNNAIKIESFIKSHYAKNSIGDVYVSFVQNAATIDIFSTKVGNLIGKNAVGIENIRKEVLAITKKDAIEMVTVNVHEIKRPNLDANIVCDELCREIEKKRGIANIKKMADTVMKSGAEGVKIRIAGRISGAEIARDDKVKKGLVNATTLRANISYAQSTALTQYGIIGVEVFINLGTKAN